MSSRWANEAQPCTELKPCQSLLKQMIRWVEHVLDALGTSHATGEAKFELLRMAALLRGTEAGQGAQYNEDIPGDLRKELLDAAEEAERILWGGHACAEERACQVLWRIHEKLTAENERAQENLLKALTFAVDFLEQMAAFDPPRHSPWKDVLTQKWYMREAMAEISKLTAAKSAPGPFLSIKAWRDVELSRRDMNYRVQFLVKTLAALSRSGRSLTRRRAIERGMAPPKENWFSSATESWLKQLGLWGLRNDPRRLRWALCRLVERYEARDREVDHGLFMGQKAVAACTIHPTHLNLKCCDSQGIRYRPCVPGRSNAHGGGWDAWVELELPPAYVQLLSRKEFLESHGGYWYELCLRSASQFAKLASRFNCDVNVLHGGDETNGKSMMGMMLRLTEPRPAPLTSPPVFTLKLRCFGAEDAAQCLASLVALLESPFRKAPAGHSGEAFR